MIIFNDKSSFNFEDKNSNRIHIPRIYLNNFNQIFESIKILKEKKYLNNSEMTKETARIRAEHIREILIILWRLNSEIEVVRENKSYSFMMSKNSLDNFLNEDKYYEVILKKLKLYVPMLAVLQTIDELVKNKIPWNEKIIEKKFHFSNSKGNSDNIHPLIRWLKGFELITKDLKISEKGKNYLQNIEKINPFYVHELIDLSNDKLEIILTEIFHQISVDDNSNFPKKINLNQLENFNFLSETSILFLKDNRYKIVEKINKLIEKKFPIEINQNELILKNPIFFDIKPKNYISFQLNKFFKEKINIDEFKRKKISHTESNFFLIKDNNQKSNLDLFPKDVNVVSYEEFLFSKDEIIDRKPKFIVLTKNWKPIKNLEISGYLDAYVRFGGNLVIIGGQVGRIGANMNMYSWLPFELSKINFLKSKNENYFKFTFGEEFIHSKILFSQKLDSNDYSYKTVSFSYFLGTITFINNESNNTITFDENFFSSNLSLSSSDNNWKNCEIIQNCITTKPERKMYPIIKEFMSKNFNFEFHPDILGHSGQTDIYMNHPFNCLFEVDTVGVNQIVCGAQKVSEVDRHYRKMKKLKYFKEASKCVLAYEFSSMSGEDRDGTIETAKEYSVNLIRYKDLYDMSCLKNLSEKDFKKIIYEYDPENPEISKKIIKLHEKYKSF